MSSILLDDISVDRPARHLRLVPPPQASVLRLTRRGGKRMTRRVTARRGTFRVTFKRVSRRRAVRVTARLNGTKLTATRRLAARRR